MSTDSENVAIEKPCVETILKAAIPVDKVRAFLANLPHPHFARIGAALAKHVQDDDTLYEVLGDFVTKCDEPLPAEYAHVLPEIVEKFDKYHKAVREAEMKQRMLKMHEEDRVRREQQLEEMRQRRAAKKESRGGLSVKEFKEKRKAEKELMRNSKK